MPRFAPNRTRYHCVEALVGVQYRVVSSRRWPHADKPRAQGSAVLSCCVAHITPSHDYDTYTTRNCTAHFLPEMRPCQLRDRHAELDATVFAAYGWAEAPATIPEDLVLARLLELNMGREGV